MFYFDNKILKRFLDTEMDLQVYVGRQYLTITDKDDIFDPGYGYGIDVNGRLHEFDYRSIQHILVNNQVIDIAKLEKGLKANKNNKSSASEPSGEKSDKSADKSEPEQGEGDEEGGDGTPFADETEKEGDGEPLPWERAEGGKEGEEEEKAPKESVRIRVGDYVQNVNPLNENFKTRGSVIDVYGPHVTYSFYSDTQQRVVKVVAKKREMRVLK